MSNLEPPFYSVPILPIIVTPRFKSADNICKSCIICVHTVTAFAHFKIKGR